MTEVVFDRERRRLTVGRWSARTTWLRPSDGSEGPWSALLGVRRNLHVLVHGEDGAELPWVELWAGEPEMSDGLAVAIRGDELEGLARIPLCGCGNRGCGNVGLQLAALLPAEDLPVLVDLLRVLPDLPRPPRRGATWNGLFSDGIPVV